MKKILLFMLIAISSSVLACKRNLKADPNYAATRAELLAQENRASYHFYEAAQNYTELLQDYDESLWAAVLLERGKCYLYAGMYSMSIKDFTQIIERYR